MGRFFRTSVGAPIDYMYRINAPLMEQTLASNDAGITQSLAENDTLDATKNFNHISGNPIDDALAQTEQQKIQSQADNIASNIQGDYANWKKQMPALRQFKQSVTDNYTNGNISKLQANYTAMKSNFDTIDQGVAEYLKTGGVDKEGNSVGISPIKAQLAKQYALNNYRGAVDPTTGAHNPFSPIPLMGELNLDKIIGDEVSKIKTDKNVTEFTQMAGGKGGVQPYFDDVSHSWVGVPADKILSVARNRVFGDQGIMQNLKQAQDIGYINGVFQPKGAKDVAGNDVSGQLINPFTSVDDSQRTPQEQEQIDAAQRQINSLKRKNPAQAAEAQKELNEKIQGISSRTKLSWNPNSYFSSYFQNALDKYGGADTENKSKIRNNSLYNTEYTQGQENWRQGQKFGQEKVLAEMNHNFKLDEIGARANSASSKVKGGSDQPTVIAMPTNSPYAYLGNDADKAVNIVNSKIVSNKKDIDEMTKEKEQALARGDTDMADYIGNTIQQKTSEQMNLNSAIDKAKDKAVSTVVPKEDQDLYANRDKIKADWIALQQQGKFDATGRMKPRLNNNGGINMEEMPSSTEFKTVEDYKKIQNYQKNIDTQYKQNLLENTKSITNASTQVATSKANDDFIKQAMNDDVEKFRVYDLKGNELPALEGGKLDYTDKNLKITGAGPSSGYGDDGMNVYANYKGANLIIVPTGASNSIIRNHLVQDWQIHGDESAKQLTKTWASPYFDAVNSTINNMTQKDQNPFGPGETHHTEIGLPNGQAQLAITKIGMNGYKVELKDKNGWKKLPNINNPSGAYFSNNAEIINSLEGLDAAIREKQKKEQTK